jgi:cell division protease FtsH
MVNEAALMAARGGKEKSRWKTFEDAKDKVLMGTERKSMIISEEGKKDHRLS